MPISSFSIFLHANYNVDCGLSPLAIFPFLAEKNCCLKKRDEFGAAILLDYNAQLWVNNDVSLFSFRADFFYSMLSV
jgi:hypothetical protein